MSAGASIAFAMECYERGIINKDDTGGIELTWGNAPSILSMLEKMAKREGFGAVLADGVKKAAEQIGQGSEEFAMHIGGQEIPYHDPRTMPGRGAMYISDPTPSRHTRPTALLILERGENFSPYPELQIPKVGMTDYPNKGDMYAIGTKYQEVFVACGFCTYLMNINTLPLVGFISAATGWDFTVSELLATGHRIQTLRQAFNIREGLRPQDFNLPIRLRQPAELGPLKGVHIDFDTLRKVYYQAMNWDPETGHPTEACLSKLGLKDLVGTLPEV